MQILTVCTGNICRSALAESHLRSELDESAFSVSSAGVTAVIGGSVPPEQAVIGMRLGLSDLHEHRGQQLTAEMLDEADLVLVATLDHRASAVRLSPAASRKTFTFREFAHLAKSVTGDDIAELTEAGESLMQAAVTAVAQLRGFIPAPTEIDAYDVVDPYGRAKDVYEESASQLVPAVTDIAKYLRIVASLEAGEQ